MKVLGMTENEIEKENKLGLKKLEGVDMRKVDKYHLDTSNNQMTKI
jgi:hypothetical protein